MINQLRLPIKPAIPINKKVQKMKLSQEAENGSRGFHPTL
jgi:hypothetical protein